jgi:hypothetical protein
MGVSTRAPNSDDLGDAYNKEKGKWKTDRMGISQSNQKKAKETDNWKKGQ